MIKLGLLGASHIHTPGFSDRLKERYDVDVVAVWDPDTAIAKKYANKLECSVAANTSSLLSIASLNAVVILSQTNLHEMLVQEAVGANKHCFVEKPLGLGLHDAFQIREAVIDAGVMFQTGYFKRGLPINLYLRQLINDSAFGDISRIRIDWGSEAVFKDKFNASTDWSWMADQSQAGVGAFGDLGTHSIDLLLFLMDKTSKLEAVTASFSSPLNSYPDCEECGEALLRFENGTIATISSSWIDMAQPTSVIISGTEGHAAVHNPPGTNDARGGELFLISRNIKGATGLEPWKDLPAPWPTPLDLFLDAVINDCPENLVSIGDAAHRCQVMDALIEAANDRRWVMIDS